MSNFPGIYATFGSIFPPTGHFFCLLGRSFSGGDFKLPDGNTTLFSFWNKICFLN